MILAALSLHHPNYTGSPLLSSNLSKVSLYRLYSWIRCVYINYRFLLGQLLITELFLLVCLKATLFTSPHWSLSMYTCLLPESVISNHFTSTPLGEVRNPPNNI